MPLIDGKKVLVLLIIILKFKNFSSKGADWIPNKVSLADRLNDPAVFVEFFLTHKIARCKHPQNATQEIPCWKFNVAYDFLHRILIKFPNKTRLDFLDRVHELASMIKVNDTVVEASVNNFITLFELIIGFDYPGREKTPAIMSIKDIGKYLTPNSQLDLDWLHFVNQAFLNHSKVLSGDEEILVEDWYIFAKILELYEDTSPKIVSDVFFHAFLFGYQHM